MIVSNKYKYIFIELPHTASTAISQELCTNYAGKPVLHKHAHYFEFLKLAGVEERNYFAFSGIRNPLDVVVSIYFKLKSDHKGNYSNPAQRQQNGGHVTKRDLQKFNFIKQLDADFATYFKRFYKFPYDNWSNLAHNQLDFIIRFEHLQKDFARTLELLNVRQIRPLPIVNRTSRKTEDFWFYYSPDIRTQATHVFSPFMKKWGYEFPSQWGEISTSWHTHFQFKLLALVRKHLFWGSSPCSTFIRRIRDG